MYLPICAGLPVSGCIGGYSVVPVRGRQGACHRYHGLIHRRTAPGQERLPGSGSAKPESHGTAVKAAGSISSDLTRRSMPTVFLTR